MPRNALRNPRRSLRLLIPHRFPALRKDLIKVILKPPNIGVESRKLPLALHLPIPMHVETVRMSLHRHLCPRLIRVPLVRHAELVVPDDFIFGDFLPARAADEVLGLEQRVAEDGGVGCHGYEFVGGHGFPDLVEEGAVVDTESGRDAFAETVPVL
jgi:hypothetical protein